MEWEPEYIVRIWISGDPLSFLNTALAWLQLRQSSHIALRPRMFLEAVDVEAAGRWLHIYSVPGPKGIPEIV